MVDKEFLNKLLETNDKAVEITMFNSIGGGFLFFVPLVLFILFIGYTLLINKLDIEIIYNHLIDKKESYYEYKEYTKNLEDGRVLSLSNTNINNNLNYGFKLKFKEAIYRFMLIPLKLPFIIIYSSVLSITMLFFFIVGLVNHERVNEVIDDNLKDVELLSDYLNSYDIVSIDIMGDDSSADSKYLIHYKKLNDTKVYTYETFEIIYSNDSSSKMYVFNDDKLKELHNYLEESNIELNYHIKEFLGVYSDNLVVIDESLLSK